MRTLDDSRRIQLLDFAKLDVKAGRPCRLPHPEIMAVLNYVYLCGGKLVLGERSEFIAISLRDQPMADYLNMMRQENYIYDEKYWQEFASQSKMNRQPKEIAPELPIELPHFPKIFRNSNRRLSKRRLAHAAT